MYGRLIDFLNYNKTALSTQKLIVLNIILMISYAFFGRLSFMASYEYANVTSVFFPPEGIALAFFILWGSRMAAGVVLGQTLLNIIAGSSIIAGVSIGLINALEGIIGGYLFHRFGLSKSFNSPRDTIIFASIIFFVLQPISATGGMSILYMLDSNLTTLAQVSSAWLNWYVGNSLGQMLFAPLLLSWLGVKNKKLSLSYTDAIVIGIVFMLIYLLLNTKLEERIIVLFSISYPLLVWLGSKTGFRAITAINIAISVIVVYVGINGSSFMCNIGVSDRMFYASIAITSLSFTSMFIYSLLSERNIFIEQLKTLANKDSLTGTNNRRHFMESAQDYLSFAARHSEKISLVIIDIDHFKHINDTYGHHAGDIVLKNFVSDIEKLLRSHDLFGRIGGEEFTLFLPKTDKEMAMKIITRIKDHFKQTAIDIETTKIFVNFSAGIAELKENESLLEILKRADGALYEAKRSGRDRAIIAS